MNNTNKKTLSIEILPTEDCNNHCTYCIQKGMHKKVYLKEEQVDKIFDFISSYRTYDSNVNQINIMLFGGEPLLNKPVCDKVFDYCAENYYNVSVITNGLLIDQYIDKLKVLSKKNLLNIQISYDGMEIHDKNRCNTSSQVLNVIDLLQRNGIKSLLLKATIPLNGFDDIYKCWLEHINILHMDYVPTIDYSFNALNDDNIDYYIKKFEVQLLKIAKYCIKHNIKNPGTDLLRLNGKAMCTAGHYFAAFGSTLNISKCHGTAFEDPIIPEHIIGNVDDKDINEKVKKAFDDHKVLETIVNDECINCDVTLCKKCCAVNYMYSNKVNYMDRWYDKNNNNLCKMYKMISKISKAYNYILQKNNK